MLPLSPSSSCKVTLQSCVHVGVRADLGTITRGCCTLFSPVLSHEATRQNFTAMSGCYICWLTNDPCVDPPWGKLHTKNPSFQRGRQLLHQTAQKDMHAAHMLPLQQAFTRYARGMHEVSSQCVVRAVCCSCSLAVCCSCSLVVCCSCSLLFMHPFCSECSLGSG